MHRNKYKKHSVATLIPLAQNGDIKALEEIIKKVQKQVFTMFTHLCKKKEDVPDLTQEALLKMAKSLSKLENPQKFNAWLSQIITNLFYDYSKKISNKVINIEDNSLLEIKDKLKCEPGEKCLFNEIEKILKQALLNLPEDLRLSIVLREFKGLSYNDIANITNSALGTVKSRISRARTKLQNELKDFI